MEKLLYKIEHSIKQHGAGYEYDPSELYLILSRNESELALGEYFDKAFALSTEINSLVGKINGKYFDRSEIDASLEIFSMEISKYEVKSVQQYLMQWYLPVKALYLYREGKIKEAEKLTMEAIAIIDELICSQKIYSFLFRLILQHSNMLTLYLKNDQYEKAFSLGGEIIDYLFNDKAGKSLYGESFSNTMLWSEMEFLRECNAYYYFKSITDKVLRLKTVDLGLYAVQLQKIIEPLQRMQISTEQRYHISQWISAELSAISGKKSDFYKNCEYFFEEDNGSPFDYLKGYFIESLIFDVNNNSDPGIKSILTDRLLNAKRKLGKAAMELATKSV